VNSIVYRRTSDEAFDEPCEGYVAVDNPIHALRNLRPLLRHFGAAGLLKLTAQVATPSRQFYFVVDNGVLVCHGKVTIGQCSHYTIEANAAVIGSIWSDAAQRGKGLATRSIRHAIDRLLARGIDRIYIDTQPGNVPMQRVIDRCGFEQIMIL